MHTLVSIWYLASYDQREQTRGLVVEMMALELQNFLWH